MLRFVDNVFDSEISATIGEMLRLEILQKLLFVFRCRFSVEDGEHWWKSYKARDMGYFL